MILTEEYSNVYKQIIKRKKIEISITEENNCYENAW
jgi:putative transposase